MIFPEYGSIETQSCPGIASIPGFSKDVFFKLNYETASSSRCPRRQNGSSSEKVTIDLFIINFHNNSAQKSANLWTWHPKLRWSSFFSSGEIWTLGISSRTPSSSRITLSLSLMVIRNGAFVSALSYHPVQGVHRLSWPCYPRRSWRNYPCNGRSSNTGRDLCRKNTFLTPYRVPGKFWPFFVRLQSFFRIFEGFFRQSSRALRGRPDDHVTGSYFLSDIHYPVQVFHHRVRVDLKVPLYSI